MGDAPFCCWYNSVVDNGKLYTVNTIADANWPTTTGPPYTAPNINVNRHLAVTCTDLQTGNIDWSRYLGGSANDILSRSNENISVVNGNLIISAYTESSDFPVTDGSAVSSSVITALDVKNGSMSWATYVGDDLSELQEDGMNIYVTGLTNDGSFMVTDGSTFSGGPDLFLRAYHATTGALIYSSLLGNGSTGDTYLEGGDLYIMSSTSVLKVDASTGMVIWNSGITGSQHSEPQIVNGRACPNLS